MAFDKFPAREYQGVFVHLSLVNIFFESKKIHTDSHTGIKKVFNQKLKTLAISGTPGEIRTPDLWIRSPALYPAELRAHRHIKVRFKYHKKKGCAMGIPGF